MLLKGEDPKENSCSNGKSLSERKFSVEYQEIFVSNWLLLVCGIASQGKPSNGSLAYQFWSPKLAWTHENTLQVRK